MNIRRAKRYLAYLVALSASGIVPIVTVSSAAAAAPSNEIQAVSASAHNILSLTMGYAPDTCPEEDWGNSWGQSWSQSWSQSCEGDSVPATVESFAAILAQS